MINLKGLLEKYPECIENTDKLKAYLNDLYTDRDDRKIAAYLVAAAQTGFPGEIKGKSEIAFSLYQKYVEKTVQGAEISLKNAEKALQEWMTALSVKIENSSFGTELHVHKVVDAIIPGNCSERGYTLHRCACGYEHKDSFTPLRDHIWEIENEVLPTCTSKGKKEYVCSICNKTKTDDIPSVSHKFGNWRTVKNTTCDSDGKKERKCSCCSAVQSETIKSSGHKWGAWIDQIFATCEADGKQARQCSVCKKIEEQTVKTKGHDFTEWKKSNSYIYERYCRNCGKSEIREREVVKIGSIIEFGTYPQNKDGKDNTSIKWRVLDIKDGKALIISKRALDCQEYNTLYRHVTWETCSIRKWMNGTFLNKAFSAEEQAKIATTTVSAVKNPKYSTNPGNATKDKVFLLSITEAEKYFTTNESRKCAPTAYVKSQGAWTSKWWLRSPGNSQDSATYVFYGGSVYYRGRIVSNAHVAVRPALWINLDS